MSNVMKLYENISINYNLYNIPVLLFIVNSGDISRDVLLRSLRGVLGPLPAMFKKLITET